MLQDYASRPANLWLIFYENNNTVFFTKAIESDTEVNRNI